ncbi:uncharacterized protein MYCFIDRAFT_173163 [Pseudocercospora fijiensis CIRAD86]|uniref:Aminoglycoside phosphotransferase domain-containing protein n=1 Tax=Pseudocercospora fijiensis (strain CIRAD86) TaxID=383855 RepID=M2Z2N6_PSEFD|nr:uncharacterized protein MYCFIDRAFT_173163 [Pseudocercospora fijiensis CIRAD86]EME84115.1 hypothetical protein MYCFIDRAFT_173163 [Pseudocercospora fijiensis CIRAD86]
MGTILLSFRIRLGNLLFDVFQNSSRPGGARVSPRRLVKWPCKQSELEALLYVAANTTIPVPKVYRTYQYHGELAIEMEYFRGCKTVQDAWHELSDQEKERAAEQYYSLLTSKMSRQRTEDDLFGPFDNISSFHRFLRGGIPIESADTVFGEKVAEIHQRKYSIRFTPGDRASLNILMRDGRIAAIVDWECAAWYPEYWEFTKAHYNAVHQPEFHQMLDLKMTRYDEELVAERRLWERYDQFLDTDPPDTKGHTTSQPPDAPTLMQPHT